MVDIPEIEPDSFTAGEYVQWIKSLSDDYPASDSWALSYYLVKEGTTIQITASQYGTTDDFLVQLAMATTLEYKPGKYKWQAFVTKGSERYLVDEGSIEIKVSFINKTTSGYDGRTHAVKVLEALEARLENRASKEQNDIVLGGETISVMPIVSLLAWKAHYVELVKNEQRAERIANNQGHSDKILVRF